jgi:CheY-like chemotaxis protein
LAEIGDHEDVRPLRSKSLDVLGGIDALGLLDGNPKRFRPSAYGPRNELPAFAAGALGASDHQRNRMLARGDPVQERNGEWAVSEEYEFHGSPRFADAVHRGETTCGVKQPYTLSGAARLPERGVRVAGVIKTKCTGRVISFGAPGAAGAAKRVRGAEVGEVASEKILIVDDAPFLRNVVREIAAEAGWKEVFEAKDSQEAVAEFERRRPNLVVLDLRLPCGGGLDLLSSIRRADPDAKIVALGSLLQKEEAKEARRRGAVSVVTKPFAREHLHAVLRHFQ